MVNPGITWYIVLAWGEARLLPEVVGAYRDARAAERALKRHNGAELRTVWTP